MVDDKKNILVVGNSNRLLSVKELPEKVLTGEERGFSIGVFKEIPKDVFEEPEEYEGNGFLTTQEKCKLLLQRQGKLRNKSK